MTPHSTESSAPEHTALSDPTHTTAADAAAPFDFAGAAKGLVDAAARAGACIMRHYQQGTAVELKADASPVTQADREAEAIILEALHRLFPAIPVVSEEDASDRGAAVPSRFFLVDPLDGTKEFVGHNGEFTVNIALIEDAAPVLGVVLAPALGRLFAGAAGLGAFVEDAAGRRAIACRRVPPEGLAVVASRSHGNAAALHDFLAPRKVASLATAGSSLKLCLVAAGQADLYPRFGRTMEWDIAAGHAVLLAAGGQVHDLDGQPLRYGKPGFENPHFVASGAGRR